MYKLLGIKLMKKKVEKFFKYMISNKIEKSRFLII